MMSLLSAGPPAYGSNSFAEVVTYSSVNSPDSTDSTSSSSNGSTKDESTTPSPPQLSPQIAKEQHSHHTIFVEMPPDDTPIITDDLSPPSLSHLTPQIDVKAEPCQKTKKVTELEEADRIWGRKTVPYSFCDMKANIFDMKKKRGRKGTKEWRKNNVVVSSSKMIADVMKPVNNITSSTNASTSRLVMKISSATTANQKGDITNTNKHLPVKLKQPTITCYMQISPTNVQEPKVTTTTSTVSSTESTKKTASCSTSDPYEFNEADYAPPTPKPAKAEASKAAKLWKSMNKPCPLRKRKVARTGSVDDCRSSSPHIMDSLKAKKRRVSASAQLPSSQQQQSLTLTEPSKEAVVLSNNDFEDEIAATPTATDDSSMVADLISEEIFCRSLVLDAANGVVDLQEDDVDLELRLEDTDEDDEDGEDLKDPLALEDGVGQSVASSELVEVVVDNLLSSFSITDLMVKIPMVDLFETTPLHSFLCSGCCRPYSPQDSFSVDLKCQTLSVTCNSCSWWTSRQVGWRSRPF